MLNISQHVVFGFVSLSVFFHQKYQRKESLLFINMRVQPVMKQLSILMKISLCSGRYLVMNF